MNSCTQKLLMLAFVGSMSMGGVAHAQQYGNPYTGAGSTMQPSQPWQQQQRQWQAQPIQPRSYPTHTPSVTDRAGNQFMWRPEIGTWVPTQLSPHAAQALGNAAQNCATAGVIGLRRGVPGASISCIAGAAGVSPGQIIAPRQAY